jgi:hypothetical protein
MDFWKVTGKFISPCVTFKNKGKKLEFTDAMASATFVEELLSLRTLFLIPYIFWASYFSLGCSGCHIKNGEKLSFT